MVPCPAFTHCNMPGSNGVKPAATAQNLEKVATKCRRLKGKITIVNRFPSCWLFSYTCCVDVKKGYRFNSLTISHSDMWSFEKVQNDLQVPYRSPSPKMKKSSFFRGFKLAKLGDFKACLWSVKMLSHFQFPPRLIRNRAIYLQVLVLVVSMPRASRPCQRAVDSEKVKNVGS